MVFISIGVYVCAFFVIKKMDLLKLGYILIPVAFLWEWIWQRENLLYGTNLEVMDFLIIRPFPFFMMGNFFHYKNNQIAEIMKKNAIYGFIILGLVTTVWERSFYDKITEERYFIYMGTFFLALGCFAYAVYLPEIRNMSWFAYVGKNLSVYIYLLHALVINIINERIGYMDITWVWIGVTILAYIVFQALEKTRRTVESIT